MERLRDSLSFMRGNVLVMTVCECIWRASIDIIWPFLSMYVLSLGGSYETIGFVMAMGGAASLILYPLGGYIADYQGRIKLIGYMTFAYGASFLIPAFTGSWQWLGVGIFVQSFVTFYFPAKSALIMDSLPPEKRGIGFAASMAIPSAFGLAAPIMGGWLIETYGIGPAIRGLYLVGFFIATSIAFIRLRFLRETVEKPNKLEIRLGSLPSLIAEAYRSVYGVLGEVPRRLYVLALLVSSTVFFASLTSSFWIVRSMEIIGLSYQQWGSVMLASGVVSVVLGIPAGGLVDRFSKKRIAGACLLIGAVQCYLFLLCQNFTQVVILSSFTTLTNAFMNPAFQSLFADMTPRAKRGRVMASIGGGGVWFMRGAWGSGVLGIGLQTMGTLLSGYLYRLDSALPWTILSGALAVIGLIFVLAVEEPREAEV